MVGDWQLVPAPLDCGLNLWEMAALPLRAPTAYHMWRRALGIYRLKVSREQRATLNVLGFGGGVRLGRRQGQEEDAQDEGKGNQLHPETRGTRRGRTHGHEAG